MNETIKIIFDTVTGILALTGFVFCVYYIFFRRRLYIKGFACLFIDIDGAGEQLEYYIRRLESANIEINKIILYSKSGSPDALNISGLLSRDYPNIKFYSGIIDLEKLAED
jgi:hypothetical protein